MELKYHAAGEGKTELDGHFGHLSTVRKKLERQGYERSNMTDLINTTKIVPGTHVVHVDLNRDAESRFYVTAANIKGVHEVRISKGSIVGRYDSKVDFTPIEMGQVRERKSKKAKKQKELAQADVQLVSTVQKCQKCLNPVKKGEDVDIWIVCEKCDRSWHKTCVGIEADKPLEEVEWQTCANCGGSDPKGEMLVKRRKAPTCNFCGKRTKRLKKGEADPHAKCKEERNKEALEHLTPAAEVLERFDHPICRKEKMRSDEKRKARTGRKRRGKRKRVTNSGLAEALDCRL